MSNQYHFYPISSQLHGSMMKNSEEDFSYLPMVDDLDEFGDGRLVEDQLPLDEVCTWRGAVVEVDCGSMVTIKNEEWHMSRKHI